MRIPFEFAESSCPSLNVLSIFNSFGAHLNFNDRTIFIPDNELRRFKETIVMGSVINSYEKYSNKQQGWSENGYY